MESVLQVVKSYMPLVLFAFIGSYLYVLIKIGLRNFKYYDAYKIIIPVPHILFLLQYKTINSLLLVACNILLLVLFVWFVLVGF